MDRLREKYNFITFCNKDSYDYENYIDYVIFSIVSVNT